MSLTMKAACEKCSGTLLESGPAYICSYECTFCEACTTAMNHDCPNCGGELVRRPLRKSESDAIPETAS